MKSINNIAHQLTPSFELSITERLEMDALRQENKALKKLKAELAIKYRRAKYESDAMLRKQQKQLEKLQLEINALKVISSGNPLNNNKKHPVISLPLRVNQQKTHRQGISTFSTIG